MASMDKRGLPYALQVSFRNISEGILWLDKDGKILIANEKVANLLHRSVEELTDRVLFEIEPHLNLLAWKRLWRKLAVEGMLEQESELITKKDQLVPVNIKYTYLEIDGEERCMALLEDQLTANRYKSLLDLTTSIGKVGSWELNLITNELLLTSEVYRLLELPEAESEFTPELATEYLQKHLLPNVLSSLQDQWEQAIAERISFEDEVTLSLASGPKRLQINVIPIGSELQTHQVFGTVREAVNTDRPAEALSALSKFTIDYSKIMILWVEEDGQIVYGNRAVCDKLGYNYKEVKALNVDQIVPGLKRRNKQKLWKKLVERKYFEREVVLTTKSGEEVYTHSYHHLTQSDGQMLNCIYVEDVSERKRQEGRLALTQLTVDHSKEMIVWISEQQEIVYANKAFLERTGYVMEESKRLRLHDIVSFVDDTNIDVLWQMPMESGYMEREATLQFKDGTTVPTHFTAVYMNYKAEKLACAYLSDRPDQPTFEPEVGLSKSYLEESSEIIFWVDVAGTVTYTNRSARRHFKQSAATFLGQPFQKYLPKYEAIMEMFLSGQYEGVIESRLRGKNDTGILVEATVTSIAVEDGINYCFIFRDVTDRKEKEAALSEAYRHIEELSRKLEEQNILLKEEISQEHNFNNIITQSKKYKAILKQISQVAETDATVLIFGETGTGKELLARAIHALSLRASEPMIKVNCAALPENLIESELFGHEKGAFTGAFQKKRGRFEVAHNGTIFLDEIGEMPLDVQAKLLRVLQEGEFERIGGNKTIAVDVRVVAATNRNLAEMVKEGRFREDLYYRLNVFPIENLPLRDRKEDIPLLIDFFVRRYSEKLGKEITKIPQGAMDRLMSYDFPGNIRELENIVERAMILSSGNTLQIDFSTTLKQASKQDSAFPSFEKIQRDHIIAALKHTNWRVSGPRGAARLLNLNDRTLASKMRKFNISREDHA